MNDIYDTIEMCKGWARLGWSVQEQAEDLLDKGEDADLNLNAVALIEGFAIRHDALEELADAASAYLAAHGEADR